jgi:hypothetical protein
MFVVHRRYLDYENILSPCLGGSRHFLPER